MATAHWNVHFSGHVQGVGFRWQTQTISERYQVTGRVANLDSGQVRLVVEGEASEIERFVEAIQSSMKSYIRSTTIEKSPYTGKFEDFQIGLDEPA